MAIQNLNPWYPLIVAVVATTLHYWFSKISEARRHKKEFLEKQISHLLLPLFIQFKKMDIKTYPDEVNPNKQSFLDELFDDTEIKKILTNNLYLASPQLSYYLLEFLYNSYRLESKDGIQEYRSTYGEDTEGSWGYLDDDFVFENYQILRNIIFVYIENAEVFDVNIWANKKAQNLKEEKNARRYKSSIRENQTHLTSRRR